MKNLILLAIVLGLTGCASVAQNEAKNLHRKENAIPLIRETFPEAPQELEEYEVFENENETYTVTIKLPNNVLGGGPSADFRNESDELLRVYFSE